MLTNLKYENTDQNILEFQKIQLVQIYIRFVSRKTIKINLPKFLSINHLKEVIHKKFNINYINQVLYLKGTQISNKKYVKLSSHNIIHLINYQYVNQSSINFILKIHNNIITNITNITNRINEINTFNTPSYTILKDFINEAILSQISGQFSLNDIVLIQSCRVLNLQKSFIQENIQNGTVITIARVINEFNSRKINKEVKQNSFIFNDNNTGNQQNLRLVKSLQLIPIKTKSKTKKPKNIKKIKASKFLQSINDPQKYSKNQIKNQQYIHKQKRIIRTKSVAIGYRQCNCKKDKKLHNEAENQEKKQRKVIDSAFLKKLQKQIRQKNLSKILRKKSKSKSQIGLSSSNSGTLNKVKSFNLIQISQFQNNQQQH